MIAGMKFAPLSTVEVEKSFSNEKAIFSDRRRSLTAENVEFIVVSHYNLAK